MNLPFNFELTKKLPTITQEKIPEPSFFAREISQADSTYYEPYQHRPYNPDELFQKKYTYEIFRQMLEDDQISACLNLKKAMVLDSGWAIETSEQDEGGDELKDFLEYNIRESLDGLFEKKLLDILTALDYGFSLSELTFDYEDTGEFGNKVVLKNITTRPPDTFVFYQDTQGKIINIKQHVGWGADIDLDPRKFMHYVYQREFDNPYGQSELNMGVYRNWRSKDLIIKMWNIYIERYGMPTAHGKYPKGQQADRTKFETILKNIQAKTSIVTPDDYAIEFLKGGGTGQTDFESAINYYNMMIARKMLIPDLVGFSGTQTSGGSYSLGQEHFGMFYMIIEQIRKEISSLINKHIIKPLIMWNYGTESWAEFQFSKVDEDKKLDKAKTWLEGVKTGKIIVTPEQQNWFLNIVEAPEVDEEVFEEEKLRKEEMALAIQGAQNGKNNDNNNTDDDTNTDNRSSKDVGMGDAEEKSGGKDKEEPAKFIKNYGIDYYRDLTTYEKKVNFNQIHYDTELLALDMALKLCDMFKLSINAMVDDIRRQRIIEKKRLDKVNNLSLKYKNNIVKTIKDYMKTAYKMGGELAEVPAKFDIIDIQKQLDTLETKEWYAEYASYYTGLEAEFIANQVKDELIEAIRTGKTPNEIIKTLDTLFRVYDKAQGATRIEQLARTLTAKAYNEGRKQQFIEAQNEITAYQFSAIMDGRTSDICSKLDQKIFRPNEIGKWTPPLHPNCRSLILPIYTTEEFTGYDNMPATEAMKGGFLKLKKETK